MKYMTDVVYISCNIAGNQNIMDFVDNLKLVIRNRMISVFCDNKFIVMLIKTRANVSKGKHIDYHYIQYIVEIDG